MKSGECSPARLQAEVESDLNDARKLMSDESANRPSKN